MTDRFAGSVYHKVSDGHFTGGDEGREARQQTQRNHQSADQFYDSAEEHQTLGAAVPATRESEQFLSAVAGEHKTNY